MVKRSSDESEDGDTSFSREIGYQEKRKLISLSRAQKTIWFGFGMSGLIGWSIAIPTVGGALLGLFLDKRYPGPHSWTLALLAAGLAFGCWNAWNWVIREDSAMRRDRENPDE